MADPRIVIALEHMVVGAVGITTVALAECAPAAELTLPQWRALTVVARTDGIRIGEVGSRVGMGLPSASRLVRRLERQGLVTTERDETDRRRQIVRPTPTGQQLWHDLLEYRRRLIADLLDEMPVPVPPELADELELVARAFARYT